MERVGWSFGRHPPMKNCRFQAADFGGTLQEGTFQEGTLQEGILLEGNLQEGTPLAGTLLGK